MLAGMIIAFVSNASHADKISNISNQLWHKLSTQDRANITEIFALLKKGKYDQAILKAESLKKVDSSQIFTNKSKIDFYRAVKTIILWKKYSKEQGRKNIRYRDLTSFVVNNSYFPNHEDLRLATEEFIEDNSVPYQFLDQYLASFDPISTDAKLYILDSKIKFFEDSIKDDSNVVMANRELIGDIVKIWENVELTKSEQEEFLLKYGSKLSNDNHIKRIEMLLMNDEITLAKKLFSLVDTSHKKLYNAIARIDRMPSYINNIILTVPRKLRSNEALLYYRAKWYKKKNKQDELVDLIKSLPSDIKFYDDWWKLKLLYGRELLKQEEYKDAYAVLINNNLPINHRKYWEAQWTSGWIALRFLDEPEIAYKHFKNLYNNVSQPVTISRAAYWLGMACEGMKNKEEAIQWYKKAIEYPIYFYGQLAINKYHKLDKSSILSEIQLPKSPKIDSRDISAIARSKPAQIAYLLAVFGHNNDSGKIFEWLVKNTDDPGEIAVIVNLVEEISASDVKVKIARMASRKNVFFVKDKFHIMKSYASVENAPLIHAIIKQESGFNKNAVSVVGATGYMQIMPKTAKNIARELKVRYSKRRLAQDIKYNVKLGSYYIKKLVDEFEGSEILAIAAYNAGPNNARRWIDEFYDPRLEEDFDKVVDWIELITYCETRNYVQRIVENMIVYKYLLSK